MSQLLKEGTRTDGTMPGFKPQHESNTPDEFVVTGERNPHPVKVKEPVQVANFPSNQSVSDTQVKAELALVKAELQAVKARLNESLDVQLTGSNAELNVNVVNSQTVTLQEQLTDVDAVSGTLTFSDVLKNIEIYNRDVNDGVFTVNNLAITVPPETSFQADVGGTPLNTVNVTGSTSYVVGRYS